MRNEDVSVVVAYSSNFYNDKASDAKINEIGDDVEVHVKRFFNVLSKSPY